MSTSTVAQSLRNKDSIIDGRFFDENTVMNQVEKEGEDGSAMANVITKLKNQGIYQFGLLTADDYDEKMVEEFYLEVVVSNHSLCKGENVKSISATVRGIEVVIDCHTLKDMFDLPSKGLTLEALESYGSDKLLKKFWQLFTGAPADEDAHLSCHKKNFFLPYFYLHDFCCCVVGN
ncbi:hypothetical protein OROMI_021094 [Orobanche minor]